MEMGGASREANENGAGIQLPFSVLIVSEIRFLREGLAEALGRDPILAISGLAADLGDALASIGALKPAIVLLDAGISDGTSAVRRIKAMAPEVRVIVLAVAETEENVIAWAEAGVAGYIPRTAALGDFVRLLVNIVRGEQICSGRVASGLIRRVASATGAARGWRDRYFMPTLTGREREIVQLISAGLSNKQIARRLNIGLSTTKSHVHNLLGKLNLRRRSQVTSWRAENESLSSMPVPARGSIASPHSNGYREH
ncbi:MAG TPA: response regulator transcription factor [Stellaceae bacterium]|nr:response regulator transcription factor [Stellaceae bacterium]